MKSFVLAAAIAAAACAATGATPAFAFGPSPSDAHPPGALFQSKPPQAQARARGAMRSSNVRLQPSGAHRRGHRGAK
jgi:hypothetical protein